MEQAKQDQQQRTISPDAKSFTDIVLELERGKLLPEIEAAIQDVVRAVLQTGKPGGVTLKLKIKPASGGDTNQLLIKGAVAKNEPYPEKPTTLYFADDDSRLMRRDPRQYDLDLKPAMPKPIRPRDDRGPTGV